MKSAFKSKPSKGTKRAKRSTKRTNKVSEPVKSYVKKLIAKNVEEKYQSSAIGAKSPVVYSNGATPPLLEYSVNAMGTALQNVTQGTGQGQRIGNEIILKKWIVKGCVVPGTTGLTEPVGTLDLYVGYRRDLTLVQGSLDELYQDGNQTLAPTGLFIDHLYYINKDAYVILKHWKVKLGLAAAAANSSNNDYQATFDFSVDLCKKGFKNYRVKYNDITADPTDLKLNSICVFGTWSNFDGSDITAIDNNTGYYEFVTMEQIEYTDA